MPATDFRAQKKKSFSTSVASFFCWLKSVFVFFSHATWGMGTEDEWLKMPTLSTEDRAAIHEAAKNVCFGRLKEFYLHGCPRDNGGD